MTVPEYQMEFISGQTVDGRVVVDVHGAAVVLNVKGRPHWFPAGHAEGEGWMLDELEIAWPNGTLVTAALQQAVAGLDALQAAIVVLGSDAVHSAIETALESFHEARRAAQ